MIPSGISETGWVVPQLDVAIGHWLALGYGPFFTMRLDIPDAIYRGRTVPLVLDVALARAGHVQVELIAQVNDGPSAYRDMYGPDTGGFHHIRHRPGDYERHRERLIADGGEIVMEIRFGAQRIFYADMRATLGCMVEVLDDAPILASLDALMVEASLNWNGSDPIRPVDLASLV